MRKRFSESEIINVLKPIEVRANGGMGTEEAYCNLGVSDKKLLSMVQAVWQYGYRKITALLRNEASC